MNIYSNLRWTLTTKRSEVGGIEVLGALFQKPLWIEPLRLRIEVLAVVAGRRREEDLRALLHQQSRGNLPKRKYRVTHYGQRLYFVDFHLGVPPYCLHGMPILHGLQLPKQNKADIKVNKVYRDRRQDVVQEMEGK